MPFLSWYANNITEHLDYLITSFSFKLFCPCLLFSQSLPISSNSLSLICIISIAFHLWFHLFFFSDLLESQSFNYHFCAQDYKICPFNWHLPKLWSSNFNLTRKYFFIASRGILNSVSPKVFITLNCIISPRLKVLYSSFYPLE